MIRTARKVTFALLALGTLAASRPARSQLTAGARVRLTRITGERMEARLTAVDDTIVWLQSKGTAAATGIKKLEIRTLHVHTPPASRRRTSLVSGTVGALVGAIAGVAAHNDTGESGPAGFGDPPSRVENIAVGAAMGGALGWTIGRYVLARSRWQPVTLR